MILPVPHPSSRSSEAACRKTGEYLRLVITDRPMTPEISDFFQQLAESRGSVLMERISEYQRFSGPVTAPDAQSLGEKSLEELFSDFYTDRSAGEEVSDADFELLHFAGELIRNNPDSESQAVDPALTDELLKFIQSQEADKK